jgi:hypothetical protein|tara:strand:- start:21 stop:191 length:171 start_codon:yes stop_codon:yes gene_type:complete
MVTQTRAKRLVKILSRLLKQEHLYTDEQLREIKAQLRVVKDEIAQAEAKTFKGFGK